MNNSDIRKKADELLKGKILILFVNFFVCAGVSILLFITIPILILFLVPIFKFGIWSVFKKILEGKNIDCTDILKDGFENFGRVFTIFLKLLLKNIIPIIFFVISIYCMKEIIASLFAHMLLAIFGGLDVITSMFQELEITDMSIALLGLVIFVFAVIISINIYYTYKYVCLEAIMNPECSIEEVFNNSKTIMYGYKLESFKLDFSFIGWYILLEIFSNIMNWLGVIFPIIPSLLVMIFSLYIKFQLTMANTVFYDELKYIDNY